jgi:hypothetical protein
MACCATLGIELEKGTPGISNTYSKDRKYERDSKGNLEPGQISFHLSMGEMNPLAVAKVWLNPDSDMREWAAIPPRLIKCKTADEWEAIADDIEALHVWVAVVHMRHFSQGKFTVDSLIVSDHEKRCAERLSGISAKMKAMTSRNGGLIAAELSKVSTPAMFAWVKAWIANFQEIRDAWQAARPSIKIERDDFLPLVIPQGKDFAKLMKRWVK